MKSTRLSLWIAGGWWLVAVLVLLSSGIAQAQEIEGTWRLVMRKLPDGKTQVPPVILGAYTAQNGLQNLNVFWRTPEGKPASYSRISTYKMSATEYTETLLFTAMNDGSDKPTTYNLTGSTESTPVAREGRRWRYPQRNARGFAVLPRPPEASGSFPDALPLRL
jgi:hypothetical protein